jgi:hypothetical protein
MTEKETIPKGGLTLAAAAKVVLSTDFVMMVG